jgi:hypothetical protein
MGRPFEIISSPRSAEETESSSEEDQSGDEGEGWVPAGEAAEDWEDPSGGVLSQVFDAAEAGDAAGLAELLRGLQVSIDTRVSAAAFQQGSACLFCCKLLSCRSTGLPTPVSTWLHCLLWLQGADSDTAIHLAALYGHADCVRVLLERGARADVADADGALPLHDAAGALAGGGERQGHCAAGAKVPLSGSCRGGRCAPLVPCWSLCSA